MTPGNSHRAGAALIAVLLAAAAAHAGVSKKVQAKFKGQILISDDALPDSAGDDAATIKTYQDLSKKELQGDVRDDVASWSFYQTAFLAKAPNVGELSLDFYRIDGNQRLYVADVGLVVDPGLTIVSGQVEISEDDNVTRGTTYEVVLSGKVGGKEVRFAKTILTLKAGKAPAKRAGN
jgi:hypothetical protein